MNLPSLPRPLVGCRVGLSISSSSEAQARGLPQHQVNRITLQFASALIGQGASLVFGHDWREDGVMEAVHGLAQQIRGPLPVLKSDQSADDGVPRPRSDLPASRDSLPPLINVLPWPDKSTLSPDQQRRLESTLWVATAPPPPEELMARLKAQDLEPRSSSHARAFALVHLREVLTRFADVRICMGGQTSRFQGLLPGITEEALRAVDARKPVYLCGFLGGATSELIASFEWPRAERLARYTAEIKERIADVRLDPRVPHSGVPEDFLKRPFLLTTVESLAETNGLSADENRQLFHTHSIEQAIHLVLKGIGKCHPLRPRA